MAKILLFGSPDIYGVPSNVVEWMQEYNRQGHEFIVGDRKGADASFHKALSSLGVTNAKIYAMQSVRNNDFDLPVKTFLTYYDAETKQVTITCDDNSVEPFIIEGVEKEQDIAYNRQWYEYRDKQLISDCDIAICLWDGESKTALHMIQLLNINNKPVYTFTF